MPASIHPIVRETAQDGSLEADTTLQRLRDAKTGDDFSRVRLAGADLSELDLSGVNLSGADLTGANLQKTQLMGANLAGAVLSQAKLDGAECMGANLSGATLNEASLKSTGLGKADLSNVSAFGVDLEHATLIEATLRDADLRSANFHQARLRDADLSGVSLQRAYLVEADLEGVSMNKSCFTSSDLRRARLRNVKRFATATFIHADIRDIDFSGAYLLRRQIIDENYLEEFRTQSWMMGIVYHAWKLTSDCGRSITRWTAWTVVMWLAFGFCYQFISIDYGDHETALSPYYFSLVTLTTLGYGDVLPSSTGAQIVVMAEVIAGYVMLGGLLSMFSSKMGRRAD